MAMVRVELECRHEPRVKVSDLHLWSAFEHPFFPVLLPPFLLLHSSPLNTPYTTFSTQHCVLRMSIFLLRFSISGKKNEETKQQSNNFSEGFMQSIPTVVIFCLLTVETL